MFRLASIERSDLKNEQLWDFHHAIVIRKLFLSYYERARSAKRVSTDYERGRRPSEFY